MLHAPPNVAINQRHFCGIPRIKTLKQDHSRDFSDLTVCGFMCQTFPAIIVNITSTFDWCLESLRHLQRKQAFALEKIRVIHKSLTFVYIEQDHREDSPLITQNL